jgi:hypothetical protein
MGTAALSRKIPSSQRCCTAVLYEPTVQFSRYGHTRKVVCSVFKAVRVRAVYAIFVRCSNAIFSATGHTLPVYKLLIINSDRSQDDARARRALALSLGRESSLSRPSCALLRTYVLSRRARNT